MEIRGQNYTPLLTVIGFTTLILLLFLNKAFNIDDPLFFQTARHIVKDPFNFYGFSINWYGTVMPMSAVNQNPPLVSYYLALFIRFFGEHEAVAHAALLLPAIGLAAGVCLLGRFFCRNALLPALFVACTPVFMVSSSNVMSDTMMICFYVWAILFWLHGMQREKILFAWLGGLCVALAFLTKYFGISAGLLLFAYTIYRRSGLHRNLFALLLPLAVLVAYQYYTLRLYGHGMFGNAAAYTLRDIKLGFEPLARKTLIGLSFTGGSLLPILFFSPFFPKGKRSFLLGFAALVVFSLLALFASAGVRSDLHLADGSMNWNIALQLTVSVAAGWLVLAVAWADLAGERSAESFLLFLWVLGTFIFIAYLNWTTTARTVLPMAPAVAFLVIRRIERSSPQRPIRPWLRYLPLLPAVAVALLVGQADYALAGTQRTAAGVIASEFRQPGRTVWFQGHWGFQYYMEKEGARPEDFLKPRAKRGDLLVIPFNNTNLDFPTRKSKLVPVKAYRFALSSVCATMEDSPGAAGFYADVWGLLPFTLGRPGPEKYFVFAYP